VESRTGRNGHGASVASRHRHSGLSRASDRSLRCARSAETPGYGSSWKRQERASRDSPGRPACTSSTLTPQISSPREPDTSSACSTSWASGGGPQTQQMEANMIPLSRGRLILLALTTLLLVVVGTAAARNFRSYCCVGVSNAPVETGVWFTGNSTWGLARRDLSTIVFNAVGFNGINNYGPTTLNPTYFTPTACDSPNYDLCIFDHPYGNNNLLGFNQCVPGYQSQAHPNQVCFRGYNKVNLTYVTTEALARHVVCHEMGHSVGVTHYIDSNPPAMADDATVCATNGATYPTNLGAHEIAHINGRY
jgi:hypothetical protein